MREGQPLHRNSPIYYLPNNTFPGIPEEFRDVTQDMVPEVLDYYMISNYGRLWHKYKRRYLNANIDSKGYLYKPLSTVTGKPKNCRIHRLVMLAFKYFPGCEKLEVDHIDGNKTNCHIWNLEWVTYSTNAERAVALGLVDYEDRLDDRKVIEVCKLLEDSSITLKDISIKTGVSYSKVQAIQGKRVHTDISDQYDIKPRKVTTNLSIDEVKELCSFYQYNPKQPGETLDVYCSRALASIGYPDPSTRYIKTAKKILSKETYWYISKDYKF